MNGLIARQFNQMLAKVSDYRSGKLDLNHLTYQLEGLAHIVGESSWSEGMFSLVLDLERVNGEVLDKNRGPTPAEESAIEMTLKAIEALICQQM